MSTQIEHETNKWKTISFSVHSQENILTGNKNRNLQFCYLKLTCLAMTSQNYLIFLFTCLLKDSYPKNICLVIIKKKKKITDMYQNSAY